MRFFLLTLAIVFLSSVVFGQLPNIAADKSYIKLDLPRTPESQGFEKYGTVPVSEYTGIPDISVPLYTLRSRYHQVPITLSYNSSGIKVNQEASFVGLGFDLICGGRITVETRGNVDEATRSITSNPTYQNGIHKLLNKYNAAYPTSSYYWNNSAKYGFAAIDYGAVNGFNEPVWHTGDPAWDDNYTIKQSAWEGVGEPDIYHASFLGHSFSFYFDIESGEPNFLGEKNNVSIAVTRASNGLLTGLTITDENGVEYYFDQSETTFTSMPSGYNNFWSTSSVTAWLLTKIKMEDDEIIFSYQNFGDVKPAYSWSQSKTLTLQNEYGNPVGLSDPRQNQVTQYPYYISSIESNHQKIVFSFGSRIDLEGTGGRKVENIQVIDKSTELVVRQYNFAYDYFTASANPADNNLPAIKSKRLKLLTVVDANNSDAKWTFEYQDIPGPNKFSFSQDHWGYFNGAQNASLLPTFSSLGTLMPSGIGPHYYTHTSNAVEEMFFEIYDNDIPLYFQGDANRNCNPGYIQAYMLNNITYPTGGYTKFEFEPHVSASYCQISNFTGGGLRIKSIKNYALGDKLESQIDYDYQNSGVYLANLNYLNIATKWPKGNLITFSSNPDNSTGGPTVGYAVVKKTITDYAQKSNSGFEIKYFNANPPMHPEPAQVSPPYTVCPTFSNVTYCPPPLNSANIFADFSFHAYVLPQNLDGKMYKNEFYDNEGNLVKSTNYTYRQAEQDWRLYSVRVQDNYLGHVGDIYINHCAVASGFCSDIGRGYVNTEFYRWAVCFFPAVSYHAVLDKVESHTYKDGNDFIEQTEYTYNSLGQKIEEFTYNSEGGKTKQITTYPTSYDFNNSNIPAHIKGKGLSVFNMWANHIYNLPVEQITVKETVSESKVIAARFNEYDKSDLKRVYILQNRQPLELNSDFHISQVAPVGSGDYDILIDARYSMEQEAVFGNSKLITDLLHRQQKRSFIWDYTQDNNLQAQCINANSENIAYSSFETQGHGNWSYPGGPESDADAVTGNHIYTIDGRTITTVNQLNNSQDYTVSYWKRNSASALTVTGSSSMLTGPTINNWTYYEHQVKNVIKVDITGTGEIDELRLYPSDAFMNTYTYKPLVGINSQCDINNRISYYEYDAANRLNIIRDEKRNVRKLFEYHYGDRFDYPFKNQKASLPAVKDCPYGYECQLDYPYTVEDGRYGSFISLQDANDKRDKDLQANAQAWADNHGVCIPYFRFNTNPGWQALYNLFTIENNTVHFQVTLIHTGSGSFGEAAVLTGPLFLPSATRTINLTSGGNMYQVVITGTGSFSVYGPGVNTAIQLNGSYELL